MRWRELAVAGSYEFTPEVFTDHRGCTVAPFQQSVLLDATGGTPLRAAQSLHSVSRRGVLRGVHYTTVPPGGAKYVYCARGSAIDFVVDLRVGSPTFGEHAAVRLDHEHLQAVYCPVGVGHAFVALEDDTAISYLLSTEYVRSRELAVSPLDPQLGLVLPDGLDPVLSERDAAAPILAEAAEAGLLPAYDQCSPSK